MDDKVQVGIIHSLSGAMSLTESVLKDAALMAIAEINDCGGILGKIIEPVVVDSNSQPQKFIDQLQYLITAHHIHTIFGGWSSSARKLALPILEQFNAQLWYPAPYEGLETNNHIFYTGACPNQYIEPAIDWLIQTQQAQKFYLIGSDYLYTRTISKILKVQLQKYHADLVAETCLQSDTDRLIDIVREIQHYQPDFVINTLSGRSNLAFYRQFRHLGIAASQIPVLATHTTEADLEAMGWELAVGHYTCGSYYSSVETDLGGQFLQCWQQSHTPNQIPGDAIATAYSQVYLWKMAVEATQSFAVDAVREAAKLQVFPSPGGWIRMENNHHVSRNCRIAKILPERQFEVVYSSEGAIKPSPWLGIEDLSTFANHTLMGILSSFTEEIHHGWQLERENQELEATVERLLKGTQSPVSRNQLSPEITRAAMSKLFRTNEKLRETQNELLEAEEALRKANEALELRVEERTLQLRQAIQRLEEEIAERQTIAEALRNSEANLQAMFAAMNDLIAVLDRQGNCLKVVPTNNEMLYGYASQQVGKSLWEFLPSDVANDYFESINKALETQKTISLEHSLEFGKRQTWFAANISPLLSDTVILVARDITDRKSAEELLRESQLRLAAIAANVPGVVYRAVLHSDNSVSMPYISPRTQEIFGLSCEEFMEHLEWVFDMAHPEDRMQLNEMVTCSAQSLAPFEYEYRVSSLFQQKLKWVRIISQPHRLDNGDIVWDGVIIDITDQKNTEASLRRAEENYRSIFENAIEGIFQANLDGSYISVNPALAHLYGYANPEEFMSHQLSIPQLYVEPQRHRQLVESLLANGSVEGFESEVYRSDGGIIWISENASGVYGSEGTLLYYEGIVQNITERKQAEEALRIEQEKSEGLLLNILPKSIVEKLKQGSGSIANRFDSVTILFADIVDFTTLSAQVSPAELLNLLNQIFSTFDRLADHYGLEKIKTIGDAYMVVGGLPTQRSDHAEAIAEMAIAMQKAIKKFKWEDGKSFKLRIGINTGPVIAGVIGIKKFIYDLWGDAVNVASRMESQGLAGGIQLTQATYDLLKDHYILEERGFVEIKGKGNMMTYLLIGRKIETLRPNRNEIITNGGTLMSSPWQHGKSRDANPQFPHNSSLSS